jgi:predicted transcriptional regulator
MLHIEKLSDGLLLFKALGSDVRLEIVRLLVERPMNMNELASSLHITNGALTTHIRKLEECGMVAISNDSTGHGNQKICRVVPDKLLINVKNASQSTENTCTIDLKVGRYSSCQVFPTCGLATGEQVIGVVDDYRYFSHPDHFDADILWFTQGYVEYQVPNFAPMYQHITQVTVSAELSSEAPGVNNQWPSDIGFYINDVFVGTWTSPGDFGDVRGIFTPDWWFPNWNQYGLLKMLTVNGQGTFMDGLKISDVRIGDLDLDQKPQFNLRFSVDYKSAHVGGLTIFGKTFGNYAQDIQVSLSYLEGSPSPQEGG